jgi:hypothetical protein
MNLMCPSRIRAAVVVCVVAVFLAPEPSHAWGRQGHRIVARVAAGNLLPATRDKLRAILGAGASASALETAIANASIWPDLIDRDATGTERWHFINVPISAPFSVSGLCTRDACVIAQIENMQKGLRSNSPGFALRSPARPTRTMMSQQLAFLIHFVGDIHQPLHAAVNGDRGGNCVELRSPLAHSSPTMPDTTNLHSVWDVDQVMEVMRAHNNSEATTARVLFERFRQGVTVAQLTPADWARESNDIARRLVYQRLGIPNYSAAPGRCARGIKPVSITSSYLSGNVAAVEQRLMQAGIRLSNILNEICKGTGCRPKP